MTSADGKRTWLKPERRLHAYRHPGHYRESILDVDGNPRSVLITDVRAGRELSLDLREKKAVLKMPAAPLLDVRGPFAWVGEALREKMVAKVLRVKSTELLGVKPAAKGKANVLRAMIHKGDDQGYLSHDVWIDTVSQQLVAIRVPGADTFDPTTEADRDNPAEEKWSKWTVPGGIEHEIVLNAKLDPALFSLDPPKGFQFKAVARPTISVHPVTNADPKPTLKQSWITFLSHRTGDNVLYRMRPDGSECSPVFGGTVKDAPGLSDGTTLYREPHWTWQSPDRKYFVSWTTDGIRPQNKGGAIPKYGLHLGRTDGAGPTRVIAPICVEAAAWSPDGKRVAYAVLLDLEAAYQNPARVSRIFVACIDGTCEEMILERPGLWHPQDWSPDGKKLLLTWSDFSDVTLFRSSLFELDLLQVEQSVKNAPPDRRWQRSNGALKEVLGKAAPVETFEGRYSPDGKFVAVTAIRKTAKPQAWKSLDFELGVIDRATVTYKKVAWYEEGLRGPICWSPDGSEILFCRPLKNGDKRERFNDDSGALRQENGLGLWSIKPDGTGEKFLTTGWSPDWR